MADDEPKLWALTHEQVFAHLHTSEKGLSSEEAASRLSRYGTNAIDSKGAGSGASIFLAQLMNPLVLVLICAAAIAFLLHERTDALVIFVIIALNTLLGFYQEYRAFRDLKELQSLISHKAKVMRDGAIAEIDVKHLVPGDIVQLNIGDIIPADLRLLQAENMTADESALTGESLPVLKKVMIVESKHSLPQYLSNMAFMGTHIASGEGLGVVIATGERTFFGKTTTLLKERPTEGDFQKNLKKFSTLMLRVVILMAGFIFVTNAVLGKPLFDSFLFALAVAVGITPEVLPIILTISLSRGARRMAKQKVIIKRLASVEDLGNMDTLCCDKTGTLTDGELALHDAISWDGRKDDRLILYGLLCNDVQGKGKHRVGSPIDRALWNTNQASYLQHELSSFRIVARNEFDFQRRRMSVLAHHNDQHLLIAKGAPESMLKAASHAFIKGKRVPLQEHAHKEIQERIAAFEQEGYSVIVVGERDLGKKDTGKHDETDLTLLGMLLFRDPPKKSSAQSLALLRSMGVDIKVVSGDSPLITRKICKDVGLDIVSDRVVTGEDLERMSEVEFDKVCLANNVFARVSPEQKYRIVSSLNKQGRITGFLGDGINDAPALKVAVVGISVDHATSIAKEEADIILLHKSLQVIANGITEGRRTFSNIMKYLLSVISSNFGNMFTVSFSSLFLPFIPLLPSQILLNNLIADIPLVSISTDNVDPEAIRKPKHWNIKMITQFMAFFGLISTFFDLLTIFLLFVVVKAAVPVLRTGWFVEGMLTQITVVFLLRTRKPFFRSMPSKLLLWLGVAAVSFAVLITYSALGHAFFAFEMLPLPLLLTLSFLVLTYLCTVELGKYYFFSKFDM